MAAQPRTLLRTVPFGTIAILLVAAFFYVAMLLNMRPTDTGDAVVGDAIAWLFLTACLWLALTAALVAGALGGGMPRPALWLVLQPLAGAALLVGGDFYSRHRNLLPLEPAVLPLIVGAYALWARLPALRARFPAHPTSVAVYGCVAAISLFVLVRAANY